jgi:hypothetical protein
MMKKLAFAALPILALAACAGEPEPEPRPDPAVIEQIVDANASAPAAPGKLETKLEKADKLVGSVSNVEPHKVAGAAEKLLAR